jgi:hypothetical protein
VSCKLTTRVIKRKRRKVVVCTVRNLRSSARVGAKLLRKGSVRARGSAKPKGGRATVVMSAVKSGGYKLVLTSGKSTVRLNLSLR